MHSPLSMIAALLLSATLSGPIAKADAPAVGKIDPSTAIKDTKAPLLWYNGAGDESNY